MSPKDYHAEAAHLVRWFERAELIGRGMEIHLLQCNPLWAKLMFTAPAETAAYHHDVTFGGNSEDVGR